jgi:hypothetical protein
MQLIGALSVLGAISSSWTRIILVAIFTVGIVLVILVPFALDIVNAHRSLARDRDEASGHARQARRPERDPRARARDDGAEPHRRDRVRARLHPGRAAVRGHPDDRRGNIIVALTTALASITAFYFGNRAATEARQDEETPRRQPGPPGAGAEAGIRVTIATPKDGDSFTLNQVVAADYSAAPSPGAQLTLLKGTVDSGAPLDTATPGEKTFTVSAKDSAGHAAEISRTYTVGA